MNTATATTAELVTARRIGWTAKAGLADALAKADEMLAGSPELLATVKAQVTATSLREAELGEAADAELTRRQHADSARRGGIFAGRVS